MESADHWETQSAIFLSIVSGPRGAVCQYMVESTIDLVCCGVMLLCTAHQAAAGLRPSQLPRWASWAKLRAFRAAESATHARLQPMCVRSILHPFVLVIT